MSVCVACNISDGVIIGVDSATTLGDPLNPVKIYGGVEKLFPLGELPVGLATYGLASIAGRTIASWTAELTANLPSLIPAEYTMADVAESIRNFFFTQYQESILGAAPPPQSAGEGLPQMLPPVLGLVLGGFSKRSFQSEVWNIQLPYHATGNSATRQFGEGQFGSGWYASMAPIFRYIKGFDPSALQAVIEYVNQIRDPLQPGELEELKKRAERAEFGVVFPGMPIAKGLEYVRFLVDLVIGHHKFAAGNPIVGGRCRVGYVTFDKAPFRIVTEWRSRQ